MKHITHVFSNNQLAPRIQPKLKMVLLSHPTGNQNSRQAVQALREAGVLEMFATSINIESGSTAARYLPKKLTAGLNRRDFSFESGGNVRSTAAVREIARLFATRQGFEGLIRHETGWASVEKVYQAVDQASARIIEDSQSITGVYAYEDGALTSFEAAKRKGLARFYELPIGYWRAHRRLCDEEATLQPNWANSWHADRDSDQKVKRKDAELAMTGRVIVPSRFVAESLSEYPGQLPPVSIIPYGCPPAISADARSWYQGGQLRVLFVGGLSQRKGLSYLLEAVEAMGDAVSLTIVGTGPAQPLISDRHRRLGSLSHAAVLEQMRLHDVFVFPSLFEGYGLVITEAMAQGMPVVITPATGPADIVTHGQEGWVVPIRDSGAIVKCLETCLHAPDTVQRMGRAALALASEWTWDRYRQNVRQVVLGSSKGATTWA